MSVDLSPSSSGFESENTTQTTRLLTICTVLALRSHITALDKNSVVAWPASSSDGHARGWGR